MLYYRRKILLATLEAFGGQLTAKSLQKYLFLFTRKQENKAFDFVPYKYGCFSFQANQDVMTLSKYGYVEVIKTDTGRYIKLKDNQNYSAELDLFDRQNLASVKTEFGDLSQNDLIRYTYVKYPFYAIKSAIASQILNEEELAKVAAQVRTFTEPSLFTIGYEGLSLEAYITKLILNDVRVLCDVRKNAYSQKYGFSKSQLEQACTGVGIEYIHIPQLGIESEERKDLMSQRDYDILFAKYEKTTLKTNESYLNIILDKIKEKGRVALTCFEKEPIQCHRGRVAKKLMSLPNRKYDLKNL
ncbi:DUF488 domain-containing protein [Alistipes sp. OttesenSCG-928-B03]|nr:DUF488 domain-containing protein [Alistipes sp. OttesenSCG-928-B03]